MGSKTSKTFNNNHRIEERNLSSTIICDDAPYESVNLKKENSKNKRNARNENKYFRSRSNKASQGNAVEEERDNVESEELLGANGTNKTNSLQRHHLQVVASGEWVNCVPLHTF